MPFDIASDVVLDPLLAEHFDVIRRAEVIGQNGRSQVSEATTRRVTGIVNMYDDIELLRQEFPEVQFATRAISVVTRFPLKTAEKGYQPDLVNWRNNRYLVRRVSPYPQYGAGFYEAICTSMELTDSAI